MHVYLTARTIELSPSIRAYVERRIVEHVQRHGGATVGTLEIQLYPAGHREQRFGCHVALFVPRRHAINIREEAGELFEAIDLAEKRLLHDLTNFRERRLTEARQPKT